MRSEKEKLKKLLNEKRKREELYLKNKKEQEKLVKDIRKLNSELRKKKTLLGDIVNDVKKYYKREGKLALKAGAKSLAKASKRVLNNIQSFDYDKMEPRKRRRR